MSALQKIAATGLLLLLVAAGYGLWATNQPAPAPLTHSKKHQKSNAPAAMDGVPTIDENTLLTAQRLGQMASTAEERNLADSAEKLADHELDLAFAAALRQIEAHPPVLTPEAQKIEDRLQKSQKLLQGDQAKVTDLTNAVASANGAQKTTLEDQLDLAKSQLELDKDEVEEASEDLLDAGGNVHQRIQMMIDAHEAAGHGRAASASTGPDPFASLHGLVREFRQWLALRRKEQWIQEAGALAAASSTQLRAEREKLASELEARKESVPELAHHTKRAKSSGPAAGATPAPQQPAAQQTPLRQTANQQAALSAANTPVTGAPSPNTAQSSDSPDNPGLLSRARQIAADQNLLTLLDQRIADRRHLADTYASWKSEAAEQTRSVLHSALLSASIVIGTLLVLLFIDRWLETLLSRTRLDRRQLGTLRSVTRVGLQVLGVVIILLVLVGLPGQLGTMLGIAGAGLTVALKDFIVAFIGWLALMGKNGIRLGDWVEINGVSGEVVELGMFHTVLLETGNWTDAGHPTGRRVTFTNSFAIQGHYFNFSTSGQWLWDELLVLVPYDRDPHVIADAIHKEVLKATAESAHQAEQEWRRAVRAGHDTGFSATPGIMVRPAVGGVEVAMRYVTRASERFSLRARLYQAAVQLLAQNPRALPAADPAKPQTGLPAAEPST